MRFSIAARDVHVTAGARLVIAISLAAIGSDALSAVGLSVPCRNRGTSPNYFDNHKNTLLITAGKLHCFPNVAYN